MASAHSVNPEKTDAVEEKISEALHEVEKQVYILCDRERSAQEGMASQSRRLVESQRQTSALQSHLLELDATINKERKRHREELEKMTEDNALIKGERDTERGQHDMLKIEVKRLRKHIALIEEKENVSRPNPRETATHKLNPRESRATPVLVVPRNKGTTSATPSTERRQEDPKILALETVPSRET